MHRMSGFWLAGVTVLLVSCATPQAQRPVARIGAPFDEAQAAELIKPGVNIVRGTGFMRQQGGGVVTCAGNTVTLVPATRYAQERFAVIYGGARGTSTPPPVFSPDPASYMALTKTTRCNAQGAFSFDQVADGNFFVVTTVLWMAGANRQGGSLYAPANVRNGQAVEVTLAP